MSQQLERERTFLAKELPQEIKATKPTRIVDIYIPDMPAHSHLRLRQNGGTYEITKKTPATADDASEHPFDGGRIRSTLTLQCKARCKGPLPRHDRRHTRRN